MTQLCYTKRTQSLNILSLEKILEFPFSKKLFLNILLIIEINNRGEGNTKKPGDEHWN